MERKPAGSSITYRLSMVIWETESQWPQPFSQWSRSVGAELVGIHHFGHRRLQPYVFAGAGVFSKRTEGYTARSTFSDSSIVYGPTYHFVRTQTIPTMLWGVGTHLRIGGASLFTEVRLPVYYSSAFHMGPQAPLLFGIRF